MWRLFCLGVWVMASAMANAQAQSGSDHAVWDSLLREYVVECSDGVTRVDYARLKESKDDRARLDGYLDGFSDVDVNAFGRDEKFAAWANIYNALTVKHIVERYPVRSIKSGYLSGPWKRVKTVVNGAAISLDEIEHDVLRPMGDARVHYAINCASYSCPNLMPMAWTGLTLDDDLDVAAHDYINHPRGVSVRNRGGLRVSEIYKWFKDDFGGSEDAVIGHLLEHADDELAARIEANRDIRAYDYDWSLNDAAQGCQEEGYQE